MQGREIFMILSGEIFVALSEEFPVPLSLDREDFIRPLAKHDELWALERKASTTEVLINAQRELGGDIAWPNEVFNKASSYLSSAKKEIEEKRRDIQTVYAIWSGTLTFLESEGFIRHAEGEGYQLTAKGFTQLNKPIDLNGTKSVLSWLIEAVDPKNLVATVASGSLTIGLNRLFGG